MASQRSTHKHKSSKLRQAINPNIPSKIQALKHQIINWLIETGRYEEIPWYPDTNIFNTGLRLTNEQYQGIRRK